MNNQSINDNYLWDRSGEPDLEVQELEEILGTLKYQPRSLQIPRDLRIGRRRAFGRALAIAAVLALLALALGLWIHFNQRPAPRLEAVNSTPVDSKSSPRPPKDVPNFQTTKISGLDDTIQKPRRRLLRNLLAVNKVKTVRSEPQPAELTPQEQAKKEQLVAALKLVSAKLNLAQRKMQNSQPTNVIRNQRKIG